MKGLSRENLQEPTRLPRWIWGGLAVWLTVVGAGWVGMTAYANRGTLPPFSSAPSAVSEIGRPRIEMFVHPHCPCSAASLRELSRLLVHVPAETRCTIYFHQPENQSAEWIKGSHWETVQQIPGVQAVIDVGGAMAKQRGVRTSGEVQVFDKSGICRFQGGLTPARGHEGGSIGQSAALSALNGELPTVNSCPVFGCLIQPESRNP